MKVPIHIVEARRGQMAAWMQQHGHASVQAICAAFDISEATARRDLAALERGRQVVRTYGGALAEYNLRFPSFQERRQQASEAKQAIARQAVALIEPGATVFFDAGTTVYAVAETLLRHPVTPLEVVTNNLPVAETLASVGGIRIHLLGGELLERQSALVGRLSRLALAHYRFGLALLGAEGMDRAGLWNSQSELVALQQRVMARAERTVACVDAGKLDCRAPVFLASWKKVDRLLTNADAGALAAAGLPNSL
ncbi:MAG TPA: DeoR/GlpR family DNA-binding transcription regulator [Chthoniobacteraceae bacterium]|nr:DeoR/GlpR family DNA-binding transcription regulator [Chthoniobacteraceae bacterium]